MSSFVLTLIRHGETNENRSQIIQGQSDVELSASGLRQAELLGKSMENMHFEQVYSSDLKRAKHTCQAVVERNKCEPPQPVYDARLRERSFGVLEGQPFQEIRKTINLVKETPRDGESLDQLQKRAISFFEDLVQQYTDISGQQSSSPPRSTDLSRSDSSPNILCLAHKASGSVEVATPTLDLNVGLLVDSPGMMPSPVRPSRYNVCALTESSNIENNNKTEATGEDTEQDGQQSFPCHESEHVSNPRHGSSDSSNTSGYSSGHLSSSLTTPVSVQNSVLTTHQDLQTWVFPEAPNTTTVLDLQTTGQTSETSTKTYEMVEKSSPVTSLPVMSLPVTSLPTESSSPLSDVLDVPAPVSPPSSCSSSTGDSSPSPQATYNDDLCGLNESYSRLSTDPVLAPSTPVYNPLYVYSQPWCPNVSLAQQHHPPAHNRSSVSSGRNNSFEELDSLLSPESASQVLVFSHGGWIKQLLLHFTENLHCALSEQDRHPLHLCPNTGVSRFHVTLCFDALPSISCKSLYNVDHLGNNTVLEDPD